MLRIHFCLMTCSLIDPVPSFLDRKCLPDDDAVVQLKVNYDDLRFF